MITQEHYNKAVEIFKADEDLFADKFFQSKVREQLKKISSRPLPPEGAKYKRSAWDYFSENGLFNATNLVVAYKKVRDKASVHPMNIREQVKAIINESVRNTLIHYAEQFSKEPINTETK